MSDPVKLQAYTEKVLYDSVAEVLTRVSDSAAQEPKTTSILVVTTYKRANGDFVIAVDGNSTYQQRLLMLELARAKTLEDMGFFG